MRNKAHTEHSGSVSMSEAETVASEVVLAVGSATTRDVKKRAPIASEPTSPIAREGEYTTLALIMDARLPSALLLRIQLEAMCELEAVGRGCTKQTSRE